MELSLKQLENNTTQVNIAGEFTFADNSKFREMLKFLDVNKPGHVRVDFSDAEFIDSAALGMLLVLKEKADQLLTEVEIAGANGQVLKVLELSRFQDLFQMTDIDQSAA